MKEIFIINNADPEISVFVQDIADILECFNIRFRIIQYRETDLILSEKCAGVIMSGSPQGDDIVEHHLPYFQWIKQFEKPVLGICAGHHITGYLYGSELLRSQEPESGDFFVKKIKADPILKNLPSRFKVKQMHNDSITLPADFELLATSSTCFNQLMKHKSKPLYTCQFHPEYFNHQLIKNFANIVFGE